MPHVEEHRFGPGRLESLVLKTWVSKVNHHSDRRLTGRLEGTYTVYCGEGWEHEVTIKEDISAWASEILMGNTETDVHLLFETHHYMGNPDARYTIADRLVEYALEDWSDPCTEDEL